MTPSLRTGSPHEEHWPFLRGVHATMLVCNTAIVRYMLKVNRPLVLADRRDRSSASDEDCEDFYPTGDCMACSSVCVMRKMSHARATTCIILHGQAWWAGVCRCSECTTLVTTSATPPIHTDGEPSSLDAQVSACPDGSHCAVQEKARKAIYFLRSTSHILAMPQARVSETVASLTPATAVRARVRGVDRVLDGGQLSWLLL
jgi:hypothetical protein